MTASRPQAASAVHRLGARLVPIDSGPDPRALLGLAVRDNPRRAQLLVSRVLGKHVPTDPRLVHATGLLLGGLVADALAGQPPRALPVALLHAAVAGEPGAAAALHATCRPSPSEATVLGFAETATALGHAVAEGLGGVGYLHSTRRPVAGFAAAGTFVEEHSHHTDHLLLPADPALLMNPRPLVLVDDELSTGRTVGNTIAALHRICPRPRYVVATLVDLRTADLTDLPADVRVDVVALARARLMLPSDVEQRAAAIRASHRARTVSAAVTAPAPLVVRLGELGWPRTLPTGARHGFSDADHRGWTAALPGVAARLARATRLRSNERTLLLGTEELMALPLRLAGALADTGLQLAFSTTTRSPALVVDEPDYALTSGITFPAHDGPADGPGPRFAYNIAAGWDHVLVVVDPPADTPGLRTGLLAALAPHARRITVVVTP